MIYITGDTHGRPLDRLSIEAFPEQKEMNKDDYVIVCGDFGGVWSAPDIVLSIDRILANGKSKKDEDEMLDELNEKTFTLLFVDGNHENHQRLNDEYEVIDWHGGKVHKIRDSVLHLMRGQVFEIDDRKIFTFGGARCHDIDDGILYQSSPTFVEDFYEFMRTRAMFRIDGFSWWEGEMPTKKEMTEGFINLGEHNNKVDFIISHDCPTSTLLLMSRYLKSDELNTYLEEVRQKVDYKKWFFGHYHENKAVNDRDICLYEQIVRIN